MLSFSVLCSALVALVATVRPVIADGEFNIVPNSFYYVGQNITFNYTITAPLSGYQGQTYEVALYRNTTKDTEFQSDFVPGDSGTLSYNLDNPSAGDDYYIRVDGPNGYSVSPTFSVEQVTLTDQEIAAAYANETMAAVFKTIKQPQEGTRYTGDVVIIIWEVLVPGGMLASLDLVTSKNGIATLYQEIAKVKPNATSYTWTIGTDVPSNSYAVRIGYPAANSVVYSPTFSVISSKDATNSTNSGASDIFPGNGFIAWSVAFATALTALAGGVFSQ